MALVMTPTWARPTRTRSPWAAGSLPSSSSPHEFDLSINVESMSACLEHAQVHIVVPVLQVMMTDARVDVKSSSSGVDGSASISLVGPTRAPSAKCLSIDPTSLPLSLV